MNDKRRPTWLWPLGLILLWLLAGPLGLVVYTNADRTVMLPEYQRHLEAIGQMHWVVIWCLVLAALTIGAYAASFWSPRRHRPRTGLAILMLPWSALLGAWWFGVNHSHLRTLNEIFVMAVFVIGPPGLLIVAEGLIGTLFHQQGTRAFERGETRNTVRLLQIAQLFRPGDRHITRIIGMALFRAREWAEAEVWLQAARRAFPRDPTLSWPLATLALNRRAWAEAIPLIREHLDHVPRDQSAWERLTEAHLETGQLEQAIKAFEHLEREDIPHRVRLADLYMRTGNWEKAIATAQRIRDLEPSPHPRFTEVMNRLVKEKPNNQRAIEIMIDHAQELDRPAEVYRWRERLLSQRPNDDPLRREVMDHCRREGMAVGLEKHLLHFVNSDTPRMEDLVELVDLLHERRDWDRLSKWIERSKELYPDAWQFILAEAQLALVNGQYELCNQLCHMARARTRGSDHVKRIDAMLARLRRAQSEDEITALRSAIAEETDPTALRWEMIEHLIPLQAFDQIVAELDEIIRTRPDQESRFLATLERLISKHPDNFTLLTYMRDLQMREGALDAVYETSERMASHSLHPDQVMRDACENLLQTNPTHLKSLAWLARHAHRTERWEAALDLLDRWFRAEPTAKESPENIQMQFEAHCALHNLEGAIHATNVLLERRHREVETLKALAELHQHHGQLVEAHACYVRAREFDDQDREIHRSIRMLDEEIRTDRIHEIQLLLDKEPNDPTLNFELGNLLYSFERHTEAIPHLQRAAAEARYANICKAKIAHGLAERNLLDLAHETLSEVTLDPGDHDNIETLKAVVYNVAEIMREGGQEGHALEAFKRLFRIDAGYRNVVQKIEKLSHR